MRRLGLALATALAFAAPAQAATVKQADLANRCFRVGSAGTFYLKPTGLGTYLLYEPAGTVPGEWAIKPAAGGSFSVQSTSDGRSLLARR